MTDYVRAYDNPANVYHREARILADKLRTDTQLTTRGPQTGVLRWKSNGQVIPEDCARLAYAIGISINLDACNRARDADFSSFLARYRSARANRQPSAEEAYERRAAFGPGATVIDIFTGQEYKT
jgi:hypothetical protein